MYVASRSCVFGKLPRKWAAIRWLSSVAIGEADASGCHIYVYSGD